jgi:predicted DCC family thiol-disulfide oxidoreductase YuxK
MPLWQVPRLVHVLMEGRPLPLLDHPVVLYDGVCNLCAWGVRFVIKRDKKRLFRFAALQSRLGSKVAHAAGLASGEPQMVLLLDGGRLHTKSSVALRVVRRLRFPWPLLSVFLLVPKPLRDLVYGFVARRRYRWFGRTDACLVPSADVQARFLDWEEQSAAEPAS